MLAPVLVVPMCLACLSQRSAVRWMLIGTLAPMGFVALVAWSAKNTL
jgi:hypothetical protein